ncbi:hypothetical protein BDZ97DRAFT_1752982 [Flammula alnicola]|nr:hypothetical protein BDZ97DRAFT_1752982 [Flammula alnicola]
MRFREFAAFYPTILAGLVIGRPLQHIRTALLAERDLLGLFDGTQGNMATTTPQEVYTFQPGAPTTINSVPFGLLMSSSTSARVAGTPIVSTISTSRTEIASPSITPLTQMAGSTTATPYPDPATVTFSSVSYSIGYVADAPTTPPAELTEWKVIGIAVITITFIATAVLSVAFFDSWWGFVCAVVCGKRKRKGRGLGEETLVPDWEKRSWEFRLASEDGHRYPTMASLESIVKESGKVEAPGVKGGHDIKSPEMAYGAL